MCIGCLDFTVKETCKDIPELFTPKGEKIMAEIVCSNCKCTIPCRCSCCYTPFAYAEHHSDPNPVHCDCPLCKGIVAVPETQGVEVVEVYEDNWKHRSAGMKCGTCMWWVEKTVIEKLRNNENPRLGRCRKRAPTLQGWPAVYEGDWCGDHKLDENKI